MAAAVLAATALPAGHTQGGQAASDATIKVNGRAVPMTLDKGYVTITRAWRAGDVVDVSLPMDVRRRGRTAAAGRWRCGSRTDSAANPTAYPTVATGSIVTASTPNGGRGKPTRAIIDGEEPRSSSDPGAYFDWWPMNGR